MRVQPVVSGGIGPVGLQDPTQYALSLRILEAIPQVSHYDSLTLMRREVMTQLTLRGFDPELEKRLRELAERDQLSLNKAALRLMRRGAGLESTPLSQRKTGLGEQLHKFSGRSPATETARIDQAIEQARTQDLELQD